MCSVLLFDKAERIKDVSDEQSLMVKHFIFEIIYRINLKLEKGIRHQI